MYAGTVFRYTSTCFYIIHKLAWSPAKDSCPGSCLGQKDLKYRGAETVAFHGKYRGRKNLLCLSQMLSISQARTGTHTRGDFNILDCRCSDGWALRVWRAEVFRSISCCSGVQAPKIKAVCLQGSHSMGAPHIILSFASALARHRLLPAR